MSKVTFHCLICGRKECGGEEWLWIGNRALTREVDALRALIQEFYDLKLFLDSVDFPEMPQARQFMEKLEALPWLIKRG